MTFWQDARKTIEREFENNNHSFLRQPRISNTMHPGQRNLAERYYDYVCTNPSYRYNVVPFVNDPKIGDPVLSCNNNQMSMSTIQQVYNLLQWQNNLNLFLPRDVDHIVDIGGGYGNLARIVKELNYAGRYTIIDFPELNRIQQYYISTLYPSWKEFETKPLNANNIIPQGNVSALVATWSINEMPMEDRDIIEGCYDQYKYVCIVHNRSFDDIDNIEYFDQLESRLSDRFEIKRQQGDVSSSHYYFMARRI